MYHITTDITDIYTGLALEELLFESSIPELLMVWRSQRSVVMGKFQSIYQEINLPFTHEYHIPIARRSTGGGTVFHDTGNINVTYISDKGPDYFHQKADELAHMLHKIGINVTLNDRLAMFYEGFKISGSAQRLRRDRALFRCTLLYDSDLYTLKQAITPPESQIQEEQPSVRFTVASVREEVGNIKMLTNKCVETDQFMNELNLLLHDHYKSQIIKSDQLTAAEQPLKQRSSLLRSESWIYEAKR